MNHLPDEALVTARLRTARAPRVWVQVEPDGPILEAVVLDPEPRPGLPVVAVRMPGQGWGLLSRSALVSVRPAEPCTGIAAAWCHYHGDCTCPDREQAMNSEDCPLHSRDSQHAEGHLNPDRDFNWFDVPIPAKGKQGLWRYTPPVVTAPVASAPQPG